MQLNVFHSKSVKEGNLIDFLFRFCLKKGPTKFAYAEYYIRKCPDLLAKYNQQYIEFKKDYRFQLNEAKQQMIANSTNANFIIPAVISEPLIKVPSIYDWVEAKLDSNKKLYDSEYHCFFETTRKVCRLFEIFNNGK